MAQAAQEWEDTVTMVNLTADSEPPAAERPDSAQGFLGRIQIALHRPSWLRAGAPAWIWLGVGVAATGFVLIAVAWGAVAGETQVYLQVPYVVSAGLVGLGLIMVGLVILNIASRHRDSVDRDHQAKELATVLDELKRVLTDSRRRRS